MSVANTIITTFSQKEILEVWQKGVEVKLNDPKEWRKDVCGQLIQFDKFSDRTSKYGWEIDFIKPLAHGGQKELSNLRPIHWEAFVAKGDIYKWDCSKLPEKPDETFD